MSVRYIKCSQPTTQFSESAVKSIVSRIIEDVDLNKESAVREYVSRLDRWDSEIVVSRERISTANRSVSDNIKADIMFAYDNVKRFAEAQLNTVAECCVEIIPGLVAGQKQMPVFTAGCYVPGGRYSHIASAIMTITTAKVAGVENVVVCSPPQSGTGISDILITTMDICGANYILNIGGAQAIATMANGLFGIPAADIIVGPGNQYVAEAKRMLFGRVGIDMVAGPTDSMILADETADWQIVATDLVGQAEHGYNSPVWLVTTDPSLCEFVEKEVPLLIDKLPEPNSQSARAAWDELGEIIWLL
jgi:sulfopropanediol 3-dehydrogenase